MGPYYETRLMEELGATDARAAPRTRLTCRSLAADGEGVISYGVIMLAVVGVMALFDVVTMPAPGTEDAALAELAPVYSSRP